MCYGEKEKEQDKEQEIEKDKEKRKIKKGKRLYTEIEAEKVQKAVIETLGDTNLVHIEEAISFLEDFPPEVILKALEITSNIKNPMWNYAKGILNNWLKLNIEKIEETESTINNFNKSKETTKERIERLKKEGKL